MDCHNVQTWLALHVGGDVPSESSSEPVWQHVSQCPQCRQRQQAFAVALQALVDSRRPVSEVRPSLWPLVSQRLAQLDRPVELSRFNVWVPTVVSALAAAVVFALILAELRTNQGLPYAQNRAGAPFERNLFATDPSFGRDVGKYPTVDDFRRWQGSGSNARLQTAKSPAYDW
jgi:predicted anti-sigma-YlaC factor YlaD